MSKKICNNYVPRRKLSSSPYLELKRLAMGETIAPRGHRGAGIEKGVEMAEVPDAAVQSDIEDVLVAHFQLAPGVGNPDVVHVISGGLMKMAPDRPRHMLAATPAKAQKGLDPARKMLWRLDGPTCLC